LNLFADTKLTESPSKWNNLPPAPEEIGEYILNNLPSREREKILKRIAVDRLLDTTHMQNDNNVVISLSSEKRLLRNKDIKNEIIFYLALCQIKGVGNTTLKRLRLQFQKFENVFHSSAAELLEKNVPRSIIKSLSDITLRDRALSKAYDIFNICRTENISFIYIDDDSFPSQIKNEDNLPLLIFYKGDLSFLSRKRKISLFGKKIASEFGIRAVNSLSASIVAEGYTVITGATTSIGTQAAFVAIQNSSPPVIVFPFSLDHATTKVKRKFINYCLDGGGLVLSPFYPGESYTFRNIFISAKLQLLLSRAMVLIESDQNTSTSHLISAAQKNSIPVIVPVPPGPYANVNSDIMKLLDSENETILPLNSRDEYYKIFEKLENPCDTI